MKLPHGIGMLAGLCRDILPTAEHEQRHGFIGVRGPGGYLRIWWDDAGVCRFRVRVDDPATGRACFDYPCEWVDEAPDVLEDRDVLAFLLVVVHGDRSDEAMHAPDHEAWLRRQAR